MSGHRQAAVALHALAAADRELILAELPAADQHTLRGYLAELRELGFESGGSGTLLAAAKAGGAAAMPALERLQAATAQQIYAALEREPASLVAQVLAAQHWRWHAEFLALCTPARRSAVQAAAPAASGAAPARRRFLLEALAQRLGQPASAVQAGHAAAPGRLLQRMFAWMR
ncbi:hypothetical protein [Massilia sp. YIM B04103]|uniref:hypothetical protein n=1 Tax=Massilia sp. YIM B04103 TaxID=2963106 RepID=UPI002109B68B|nr:hypothetical protein [Massilia sp. YIM B04103]